MDAENTARSFTLLLGRDIECTLSLSPPSLGSGARSVHYLRNVCSLQDLPGSFFTTHLPDVAAFSRYLMQYPPQVGSFFLTTAPVLIKTALLRAPSTSSMKLLEFSGVATCLAAFATH
jgi:hypothetical protein